MSNRTEQFYGFDEDQETQDLDYDVGVLEENKEYQPDRNENEYETSLDEESVELLLDQFK